MRADGVAFGDGLGSVRIVAIGTGDTVGVHPGLQERAIDIDLVQYLAIRVVLCGP